MNRPDGGIYFDFHEEVRQARAQSRVAAEAEVRRDNPLAWLRYGPGRQRPGEPGWTESRELLGQDGGPVRFTLDLGGSRQLETHPQQEQLETPKEESSNGQLKQPSSFTLAQPLYAEQEAAIFTPARYSLIEASTKSGKTYGCLAWLFEQAILHGAPGRHYWWVAPILAQAKIAYRRMKDGLPQGLARPSETDSSILLPNGATIWFRSGEHPDSLYGEDVWAAVIDEATRVKPEAWHALRSTLTATGGPVRIIGNVSGRRNWAYQLARRAEAGEPDMHYAKITAYDAIKAGVLAQEEVEDARRNLSERVFRELYLAEPADSLTLIYSPFGPENVTEAAEYVKDTGRIYVGYDWGFTDPTHIGLYQYRDGALYQFDELVGSGRSEASWVEEIVARITALPGYDGPTLDGWRKVWVNQDATLAPSLAGHLALCLRRRPLRRPVSLRAQGTRYGRPSA